LWEKDETSYCIRPSEREHTACVHYIIERLWTSGCLQTVIDYALSITVLFVECTSFDFATAFPA
jgi:hypothetical protein